MGRSMTFLMIILGCAGFAFAIVATVLAVLMAIASWRELEDHTGTVIIVNFIALWLILSWISCAGYGGYYFLRWLA